LGLLFLTIGYENAWHLWKVPTYMPYFGDARALTAGSESHALGYDPLLNNPKDPWGRPMNYPRIWQLIFYLKLDQSDTLYVGLVFFAMFFLGTFLITKNIDRPTAWLMAGLVFSPAVLLGFERANIDLVTFFLLALAVYTVNKSRLVTAAIVGLAFLLKLYPIFGIAILLRERKKTFLTILVLAILACGIYTWLMFDELKTIRAATPKPTHMAYGLDVVWMRLRDVTGNVVATTAIRILSYAMVLVALAFALFKVGRLVNIPKAHTDHVDSFRVGAGVYVGSFLIGANWDYRLMFLLFAIPQLMDWRRSPDALTRQLAVTTLVSATLSMWCIFIGGHLANIPGGPVVYFLLDSACKWMTFCGLLFLLFYSCPEWLISYLPFAARFPGGSVDARAIDA